MSDENNIVEEPQVPVFQDINWDETKEGITIPVEEVKIPTDIWLKFNTISVGVTEEEKETFDLKKILRGLEKLADNFTEE